MESTEVKTQETTEQTEEQKTFTQAELNAIVQQRVRDLTSKYENYEELKEKAQKYDTITESQKTELQKANEKADALEKELDGLKKSEAVRKIRAAVSEKTGVPADLLTGETEEDCNAQAEAIMSFAKPEAYPAVKDKGEVRNTGNRRTRDQFADWFNQI